VTPATPQEPGGTTLYTYSNHTGKVNAVAWSPDGTRIASASDDTTVQIWQIAQAGERLSGMYVSDYRGHSNFLLSRACLSLSGGYMLMAN